MLPIETFQFHLSNTFQMFHKCVCWLQCSKIDPDLEMFLKCSHSCLGTLAPSVKHYRIHTVLSKLWMKPKSDDLEGRGGIPWCMTVRGKHEGSDHECPQCHHCFSGPADCSGELKEESGLISSRRPRLFVYKEHLYA